MGHRRTQILASLRGLPEIGGYLRRIKSRFETAPGEAADHARAAEWFLDNTFLLQRTLRQVGRDMPRSFYLELPVDESGELAGFPRVYRLASELVAEADLAPDRQAIESFVDRVQRDAPLSMAELWALPSFLRLCTIEQLVATLARVFPAVARPEVQPRHEVAPARLDDEDRVAACVRTLRCLDGIDWKEFFRRCSQVERILEGDPAGVYARMDFATQDRYRKVVEQIARRTGREEGEVARTAVALAAETAVGPDVDSARAGARRHVGHLLLGEGRDRLERTFGYRPPAGELARRLLVRHPTLTLLGGIAFATVAAMFAPVWYLAAHGADPWTWAAGAALALIPASTLGLTVVHWFLTSALPPRVLPKMSFADGIPSDSRTIVIVPCLLGSANEVQDLVRQLEIHYLRNPDPQLRYALLSDFVDAPREEMPTDDELLERAETGVRLLNRKYGRNESGPFHLFHRERRWNPSEGVWMGWERKRGKLEQFNAFLLDEGPPFARHVGDEATLEGIRYVITLDAGTLLPRGTAARLVGILAHPLNRPEVDETGRVTSGYTVVQPRVEITPASSNQSRFTRIFAGDSAIDIYSRAVSHVYQDLCGQGIYVGKGIYDLRAFHTSLDGVVPENALVSHDHFEGLHGRVALASDVTLFEDYPPQYLAYTRRLHRWMRGDWQLLPWLRSKVRDSRGRMVPNRLSRLGRWILFDNLRRSLLAPVLVVFLASGWLWLPGNAIVWTLAGLLPPAGHIFTGLVSGLMRGPRRSGIRPWAAGMGKGLRENVGRWALYVVFLTHEAFVTADAIVRTLGRLWFTRRRFLEWRTAEHTAQLLAARGPHAAVWSEMIASPLLALVLAAAILAWNPEGLPAALPLLGLWLAAPEIARRISKRIAPAREELDDADLAALRRVARRTWYFYETFVGPEDQWLPPDNFQEHPRGEVAHRTSPTNVAMLLTSTLSAYDLGYLGATDLVFRLKNTLETLDRMERYRGHLYNWYDTRTLEPLPPRYVSTVDSGNLAAALLVVQQGCAEVAATGGPLPGERRWKGLEDDTALLEEAVRALEGFDPAFRSEDLLGRIESFRLRVAEARDHPEARTTTITELDGSELASLDHALIESLSTLAHAGDQLLLREVRLGLERLHRQVRSMRREIDLLAPWLPLLAASTAVSSVAADSGELGSAWRALRTALPAPKTLAEVTSVCEDASPKLARFRKRLASLSSDEARVTAALQWCDRLASALRSAAPNATGLQRELLGIGMWVEDEIQGMDFGLLYDKSKHLFHIGFNATAGELDANHYDLLASEARIASFIAIAKGDAPVKHWFFLRRPMTRVNGRPVLLSWGATMFEYLMPMLWMEDGDRTLLAQSARTAVDAQIAYGKRNHVPWGISESGFFHFDAQNNYQYRSFGVPGLGLKRGLADDLVIAPYASVLGLGVHAAAVARNLERFRKEGVEGTYGLYEAVDFTPERLPPGRKSAIVKSHMAHHQGMILAAIDNYLHDEVLVRRFHASPLAQAADLLLYEQVPPGVSRVPRVDTPDEAAPRPAVPHRTLEPWRPQRNGAFPELHLLSNGPMTTALTDAGGGWLRWHDLDLTRWAADTTCDGWGSWIYVRDEDTGELWSIGRHPTHAPPAEEHVVFLPHLVEFQRRDLGILVRMEVAVAPRDDVEVRSITLINETDRPRRLSLTSCAEPALAPSREDARHPAFSKLFIESEYVTEHEALIFHRRPRSGDERPVALLHRLIGDGKSVRVAGHETDRSRFLGRCRSYENPSALDDEAPLGGTTGRTLDPVMAIQGIAELEPFATARLAFVTIAAGSRQAVLDVAQRFRSPESVDWVFEDAEAAAARESRELGLDPGLLPTVQRLTSLLVYPSPALRCEASLIESNQLGKPRLWGHGISGDLPIVLLELGDPKQSAALPELLRAHHLWRRRGLEVALVILLLGSTSYAGEDEDRVLNVIGKHRALDQRNRRGGIFVVHADQIHADERALLKVAARAVLDGSRDLRSQTEAACTPAEVEPPFTPPLAEADAELTTPPLEDPSDLQFDNGLGGFSADGKEYVVRTAPGRRTPAPWCNILANEGFGCLVSESGLGTSWAVNASQRRLTTWSNDAVSDPSSEAVYLRDEETGAVWTTTPLPAGMSQACRVHHGAGYTEYRQNSHGLVQRMRVFVPRDDPIKIVELRLENAREHPRRLTLTYYAELVLGESREESQPFTVHEFDEPTGSLLARNAWTPEFAERTVFLTSGQTAHGVTVDRTEFLGRGGSVRRPAALERWGLSGRVQPAVDPCQALMVHVELPPGAERRVVFVFGEGADRAGALELIRRYRQPANVKQAWEELQRFWDGFLGSVSVRTPEPSMDLMLNRWLRYESLSSRIEARMGFYQCSGAFGFRDQLQDVMALVHGAPERARAHLLEAARRQFEVGDVLHWWHPPSGRGVRTRCSDDLLWLPFVTAHYVRATGDRDVLSESIPYLEGEPLGETEEERYGEFATGSATGTLMEHCLRALEHGRKRGRNGLPLFGTGDWNDGMNHVGAEGQGESVWLAWFVMRTATDFASLLEESGRPDQAAEWRAWADELRAAAERNAWDGGWYLRGWFDDGTPLGSKGSEACRIDLIAQAWSAIAGAGSEERVERALRAAEEALVRPDDRLVLLLQPPFDFTDHAPDPGYIRGYPPGIRENGGQYTHAAAWLGWAFATQRDGDRAERIFRILNPVLRTRDDDDVRRYLVEPYVIAADVAGVEPHVGRGGWTWYTGAAAWTWRLGVEQILGIRREGGDLVIDPCIPAHWAGFEAWVRTDACECHVRVENPGSAGAGVVEVTLDGEPLPSNVVPLRTLRGQHDVRVRLGAPQETAAGPTARG